MKKYLLLIPTLFVMLLNCLCSFNAYAEDIDYAAYYKDLSEIPEVQSYSFIFDSSKDPNNPHYSSYLRSVDTINFSFYDNYVSGENPRFSFKDYYFDLSDVEFSSDDSSVISLSKVNYQCIESVYYRYDGSLYSYPAIYRTSYIYYDKHSGYISTSDYPFTLSSFSRFDISKYSISLESNHPDFPLPYFLGGSSDKLKVEVEFDPLLSGTVDRNVSGSLVSSFKMNITNSSKSPIQYRMAIFEGNVSSFDSCFSPYNSSNCIFVYMSHDWIYSKDVSKMRSLTATDNLLLQNVGTSWHYLEGKSSFSQTFNYSQINFSKDKTYSVVVEAGLTDLEHASSYFVENIVSLNRVENRDKENLKYILDYSTFSTVFSSTFIFDSLKGISYDSSDNSFGIIANSSSDDYTYAIHDRQAFYDENGNLDFIGYNPFDDEDSYVYNPLIKSPDEWKDENNILYDDSSSLSSIYSSIGFSSGDFSFGSGFSNFGSMLGSVFNIFPSNFWKMFTAGFISIIVIAIVKAVK